MGGSAFTDDSAQHVSIYRRVGDGAGETAGTR